MDTALCARGKEGSTPSDSAIWVKGESEILRVIVAVQYSCGGPFHALKASTVMYLFRNQENRAQVPVRAPFNAGEAQADVRALGMGEVAGSKPVSGTTWRSIKEDCPLKRGRRLPPCFPIQRGVGRSV